MTLLELKNKIGFTFDIADDEIDASFYIELDEINTKLANRIEVVRIDRDLVVCRLTDFLRNLPKDQLARYIEDNYYDGETKDTLIEQLIEADEITDDDGYAVYHFIEADMYDFLTQGE